MFRALRQRLTIQRQAKRIALRCVEKGYINAMAEEKMMKLETIVTDGLVPLEHGMMNDLSPEERAVILPTITLKVR